MWRSDSGKRWLVPLAVFLCVFGLVLILADDRRGAGAVHLRDLLSMDVFRELLACPACGGEPRGGLVVRGCGARFDAPDGIPDLRLPGDSRTDAVRRFYERAPFPGYPPRDSLQALRARAERSVFARLLDRAIPGDARIVEIGCGTGQMCLYLARADRVVVGADLTRASLAARRRGRGSASASTACSSWKPICSGPD